MKFEFDISEFWLEEGELEDELKKFIIRSVVSQISKNIEDRVQEAISTRVDALARDEIAKVVSAKITECVDAGTIIINRTEISIVDHIKSIFENNQGWNSPHQYIAKLAENFGKATKASYDAAFENKIVAALNEQGMLKDEVVRLLIK